MSCIHYINEMIKIKPKFIELPKALFVWINISKYLIQYLAKQIINTHGKEFRKHKKGKNVCQILFHNFESTVIQAVFAKLLLQIPKSKEFH